MRGRNDDRKTGEGASHAKGGLANSVICMEEGARPCINGDGACFAGLAAGDPGRLGSPHDVCREQQAAFPCE